MDVVQLLKSLPLFRKPSLITKLIPALDSSSAVKRRITFRLRKLVAGNFFPSHKNYSPLNNQTCLLCFNYETDAIATLAWLEEPKSFHWIHPVSVATMELVLPELRFTNCTTLLVSIMNRVALIVMIMLQWTILTFKQVI